jgi:hypothetical protein
MPGYPIENNFTYHAPSGDQPSRYEALRAKAKELAVLIDQLTPVCREQSLAFTNLEQAIFWANASIARNANALSAIATPPGPLAPPLGGHGL